MVENELIVDIKQNPSTAEIKIIEKSLYDFNNTLFGKPKEYAVFIKDSNNKIQGGIIVQLRLKIKLLYIDYLWITPEFRNKGFGTKIVTVAEQLAKDNGCKVAELETLDFQAEAFYQKLGYGKFGVIKNYMGKFDYIFMRKHLDN